MPRRRDEPEPGVQQELDVPSQPFLEEQLDSPATSPKYRRRQRVRPADLSARLRELDVDLTVDRAAVVDAVNRIRARAAVPIGRLPDEIIQSISALSEPERRLHGSKFSLAYFPGPLLRTPCGDRFGYASSAATRSATKLAFNATNRARLVALGQAMAAPGRDTGADSPIPAGFTYVGQFVDHDITLDVSSSLDVATDANTIHNMRSPALDLDSVYGRGPALDPFLFDVPGANSSAIKMKLGSNLPSGPGGPGGPAGAAGMVTHTDRDVPRVPGGGNTAVIGDPRNDENLVVVQFHHAMLRFHNAVVDLLLAAVFNGDIFIEAKRIVTHHYQWAVVHDFLDRVCGTTAVNDAMTSVSTSIGSVFRMPVEFSVAAYRFGHSMIRDRYWLNFNFVNQPLSDLFVFNRNPHLPVRSNWIVDFNAFLETGIPVPVFNQARKIDTALANGLTALPGFAGLMAELAKRNLLRGLALGLPSGQGMAAELGVTALTPAELTAGLPADELSAISAGSGTLLDRTPLWYYVLREAVVQRNGDGLGELGGRIVAETFVRMLKRDPDSFLNVSGGFVPMLPSVTVGQFTFADLVQFSGTNLP